MYFPVQFSVRSTRKNYLGYHFCFRGAQKAVEGRRQRYATVSNCNYTGDLDKPGLVFLLITVIEYVTNSSRKPNMFLNLVTLVRQGHCNLEQPLKATGSKSFKSGYTFNQCFYKLLRHKSSVDSYKWSENQNLKLSEGPVKISVIFLEHPFSASTFQCTVNIVLHYIKCLFCHVVLNDLNELYTNNE